ncbi:cupin domain-containing protein [Paraglaciecola sp. L1A13]|uniref:cupin domain-containing protein n=1 Tax=Paraglaciecola sp. L1A13 TaxID=2686359 RepID=UPI00131C7653|nr:cupin domain-containing protein [Paraglaciecola sp. L1A13]
MKTIFVSFFFTVSCLFSTATYSESIKPQKPAQIEFSILQKSSMSWDSGTLPKYLDKRPEITIIKVVIPSKTSIATHKHDLINFGYLVRGQLSLTSDGGQTITLNEGDTIIELVNSWHSAKNEGLTEVEIIVFYLGPSTSPLAIYKDAIKDD